MRTVAGQCLLTRAYGFSRATVRGYCFQNTLSIFLARHLITMECRPTLLTINLTTTYQRLGLCRIALTSLLLQSQLPDRVNLWISTEPYLRDKGITDSSKIDQLIESLPSEGRDCICIRWVSNIGPYRKLIPMLRESGPDDVIVTADDDIFYGRNWLSKLLQAYKAAGGKPVASRVRTEIVNFLGRKTSYSHWPLIKKPMIVRDKYIVTFGGGAILTRAMFREQDIGDNSFLEVAPTADDLWYSKLLRLRNNEVVVVPELQQELNFIKHDDGLIIHNSLKAESLLHKVRLRIWDRAIGFLGVPVCGNDVAYAEVDRYFSKTRGE